MTAWEDVLLDSGDQRKPAEWWWAYVTDVDPLRIRRELETHPLGSTPSTIEAGLEIGDKVRVVNYLGQALIVGRAGGSRFPYQIERGTVSITPTAANTPIRTTVTLPAGVFTEPPDVLLTVYSGTTGSHTWRVSSFSITETDFIVNFMRSGTTTTEITWVAIGK